MVQIPQLLPHCPHSPRHQGTLNPTQMRQHPTIVFRRFATTVWLATCAVGQQSVQAVGGSATDFVPSEVGAYLFVPDSRQVIGDLRRALESWEYQRSEIFHILMQRPGIMPARLAFLSVAQAAGKDGWGAAEAFAGTELVAAIGPGEPDGQPGLIVVVEIDEAAAVDAMLSAVHSFAGFRLQDGSASPEESIELGGSTFFTDGKGNLHGRIENALVFATSRSLLERALTARAAGSGRLTDDQGMIAIRSELADRGPGVRAIFRADAERICAMTGDVDAFTKAGQMQDNPVGGILFAGLGQSIAKMQTLSGTVLQEASGLRVDASIEMKERMPETHRSFVVRGENAEWDARELPGYVGEFSMVRDWQALFTDRESYLDVNAAGQLVNFANTMTTLMGGLNYTEDYLPKVHGPIRFIAAHRDYSESPYRPTPQLPAMAWITSVDTASDPTLQRRLFAGTQMAVSIASLDRAQKGQPTFMMETGEYRGAKILTTFFPNPPEASMGMMSGGTMAAGDVEEDPAPDQGQVDVPVDFNFEPAAAVVDGQYVITTSPYLLRTIIDHVMDQVRKPDDVTQSTTPTDLLDVDGTGLITLARANFKELITGQMLKEDLPRARVEKEVEAAFSLGSLVRDVRIETRQELTAWRMMMRVRFDPEGKLEQPCNSSPAATGEQQ